MHLDSIGIRQGECVAVNLTNSIDHFILMLGLLCLGSTPTRRQFGGSKNEE